MVARDSSTDAVTAPVGPGAGAAWDDAIEDAARLDRYLGIGEIGRGGMGRVLRAYDPKLRREVALKVLRGEPDAEARARMMREAQALARLSHPNVVAVHDVHESHGRVFLALEYVQGQNLREWLDAAPRSIAEILAVFRGIGRGLAAAHAAGLVHRDVKPGNVLVGDDGRVRVTDFGLARAPVTHSISIEEHDSALPIDDMLTLAGTVLGTPLYMAPEQHTGGEIDARTDQYAFCVALFVALVGRPPFAGEDIAELLQSKRAGPPAWPKHVPRWIARAVTRGLAIEPEARHRTMEDLLVALADDPSRRRRRWQLAGAGVVGVVAVVGAHQWSEARVVADCRAQAAAIAEVWDDAAGERVAAAFVASGSPIGGEIAEHTRPWLDAYAQHWAEIRETSCLAAELHETRTTELDARARDCLTEKRAALLALREQYELADVSLVNAAVTAAASLPPVGECGDEQALQRRPRPLEADLAQDVADVRADLVRARALISAGRWDAALGAADDALMRARTLQWDPLVAEALLHVGWAQLRLARFADAERTLEDAFLVAGRIGHDDAALDAAQRLTFVVGARLARADEGMRWGRIAQMLLARTGQGEALRGADVLNDIGTIHIALAQWDEASDAIEHARTILVRELPPEHPVHARNLANLAAIEHGRGKPEVALRHTREALAALQRAVGPVHPEVALLHQNIASMLDQLDRDPLPELKLAIDILERTLGPEHADLARPLADLALVLAERDRPQEAADSLERARAIVLRHYGADHPESARLLSASAVVHREAGDTARARTELESALAIYRATYGEQHRDVEAVRTMLAELPS